MIYPQRVFQKLLEITLNPVLNTFYKLYLHLDKDDKSEPLLHKPLISVIVPTYNTPPKLLLECVNSVINQTYDKWEICISDGGSKSQPTIDILKQIEKFPKTKIFYSQKQLNISQNTNSCLKMTEGKFVAFLDHDDILRPNALYEVAKAINKTPKLKVIYSDEDKIDHNNRHHHPFFKPNFNRQLLYNLNYISHLTVLEKKLISKVGEFNPEFDGAQDWDYFLRCIESVENQSIHHVNKILYSWRKSTTSTAANPNNKAYAYENQKKVLLASFKRRGIEANITKTPYCGIWQVNNQPFPKPYQLLLNSLITLIKLYLH